MHGHLDVIYFNSKISDRTRVYMCVYIYIYIYIYLMYPVAPNRKIMLQVTKLYKTPRADFT